MSHDYVYHQLEMRKMDPVVLQAVPRHNKRLLKNFRLCQRLTECLSKLADARERVRATPRLVSLHCDGPLYQPDTLAGLTHESRVWVEEVHVRAAFDILLELLGECCCLPVTGESPAPHGKMGYLFMPDEHAAVEPVSMCLGLFNDPTAHGTTTLLSTELIAKTRLNQIEQGFAVLVSETLLIDVRELHPRRPWTQLNSWAPPKFFDGGSPSLWHMNRIFWCAFSRTNFYLVLRAIRQQHIPIPDEVWVLIEEFVRTPPFTLDHRALGNRA